MEEQKNKKREQKEVKNEDDSSATCWSEFNDSTPDTNSQTIAGNTLSTSVKTTGQVFQVGYVYAKCQASGEDLSAYHRVYSS